MSFKNFTLKQNDSLTSSLQPIASSVIVGIDLGTTNSLIGLYDAGFPILLADQEGSRLTPSVV
ncbi:MAG: Hsp70 family protein, partial [Chthoniobacterales bacterium]